MGKFVNAVVLGSLGMVVVVVSLGALGSSAVEDEFEAQAASSIDSSIQEPVAETESATDALGGSTIYEQAVLDAFDNSGRNPEKKAQAADFIAATINSNGYLCADLVEAQKASAYLYGIGCITRDGSAGRSNYLMDIENGSVTAI